MNSLRFFEDPVGTFDLFCSSSRVTLPSASPAVVSGMCGDVHASSMPGSSIARKDAQLSGKDVSKRWSDFRQTPPQTTTSAWWNLNVGVCVELDSV